MSELCFPHITWLLRVKLPTFGTRCQKHLQGIAMFTVSLGGRFFFSLHDAVTSAVKPRTKLSDGASLRVVHMVRNHVWATSKTVINSVIRLIFRKKPGLLGTYEVSKQQIHSSDTVQESFEGCKIVGLHVVRRVVAFNLPQRLLKKPLTTSWRWKKKHTVFSRAKTNG